MSETAVYNQTTSIPTTEAPVPISNITIDTSSSIAMGLPTAAKWSDSLPGSWRLVLGLSAVFGVSVICVYVLVRCVFNARRESYEEVTSSTRQDDELKGVTTSNSATAVGGEGSRLLQESATTSQQPQLSASRARFLEQRKSKSAQQYGTADQAAV